jgi:hypothetical protein
MQLGRMVHTLLFILGLSVMVLLVPLATLAATSSWRDAWRALVGYVQVMAFLAFMALIGALLGILSI